LPAQVVADTLSRCPFTPSNAVVYPDAPTTAACAADGITAVTPAVSTDAPSNASTRALRHGPRLRECSVVGPESMTRLSYLKGPVRAHPWWTGRGGHRSA